MKIRKGFVSNSSSSSFVVAFPHKPETVEGLKEMMFGKQDWHYDWISKSDVPTLTIAEKVFAKVGEKVTNEDVFESIRGGWFGDYYGLPGYADEWDDPEYKAIDKRLDGVPEDKKQGLRLEMQRKFWDKYSEINDKRARDIANTFLDVYKDRHIAVMVFSDNKGEAVEEHTGIFERLQHIRTSYH